MTARSIAQLPAAADALLPAAFNAIALPVVVLAALAAWLFARNVLLPAWRAREFSVRYQGLPLCIVLALAADCLQTLYYATGRIVPGLWPALHLQFGTLALLRLLVLSASIVGLAAFAALAGWRWRLPHVALAALALWSVAFLLLMVLR